MRRAALALLTLLALLLPFEARPALVWIGPLAVTNVELVLYLALMAGAATLLSERGLEWTGLDAAVAAWGVSLLLSAAFAETARAEALKFALRGLAGCALFFVAAHLVRAQREAERVVAALVAGGVVSALAGIAEAWFGVSAPWRAFKDKPWQAEGVLRASGTLAYPTTAAIFWAAGMFLAVGWGATRPSRVRRWAGLAAALVLAEGLVLSASRAGLLVATLALLVLALVSRRRVPGLFGAVGAALAGLIVLTLADFAARPGLASRWGFGAREVWYDAEYRPEPASLALEAGSPATLLVRVRNRGALGWAAGGTHPMSLGHEWRGASGAVVSGEAPAPLPRDVAPDEEVTVAARLLAPARAGEYRVVWRLVQGGVAWEAAHEDESGALSVRVTPSASAPQAAPAPGPALQRQPTRPELWRAGFRLWRKRPLLGVGPDNFRRLYARELGPLPLDDRVHANSLYVETLADQGLVGGVALVALMAALAGAELRRWRGPAEPAERTLALAIAAALCAFFAHGLVDHFLGFTPSYGLFWMLGGLTASRMDRAGELRL